MTACLWCNEREPCEHYHPPHYDVEYICSRCTLLLASSSQARLRELQDRCKAKGLERKLEALKSFIGEDEYVPKTTKARRSLVRERPLRTARFAHY